MRYNYSKGIVCKGINPPGQGKMGKEKIVIKFGEAAKWMGKEG